MGDSYRFASVITAPFKAGMSKRNTCGRFQQTLKSLLDRLDLVGVRVNWAATYISLLQDCVNRNALSDGRIVHAHIISSGLTTDVYLSNHLILMYNKCDSVMDARQLFDKMPVRNVVSWNAMIGGYAKHCHALEAFKLLQKMQYEGINPDKITFITILKACARPETLAFVRLIHSYIADTGTEIDIIVGTVLVDAYGKCATVDDAQRMFDRMLKRNTASWNVLIAAYARNGYLDEAFRLIQLMQQAGVTPDQITFINILNSCASTAVLALGKLVHGHIVDVGFQSDVVLGNALINMYGKCGSFSDACRMLNSMPFCNVVSWTAMIDGYSRHGYWEEAFNVFQKMQQTGVRPNKITFVSILNACALPEALALAKLVHAHIVEEGFESDLVIGNALINAYWKCGSIKDSHMMFHKIPVRDMVSWNSMIAAYSKHEHGEEALKLFQWMQREGMRPDKVTFVIILDACSWLAALPLGKMVHAYIIERGFELDVVIGTALVRMYGKCRSIDAAVRMFNKMPNQDVVLWNAMIGAYVQHGCRKEVLKLFQRMGQSSVRPNKITFISILNACDNPEAFSLGKLVHGHIVDQGFEFDVIVGTALVSMYGKCGSIEDACMTFDKMPERNLVSWNVMIAAFAQHGCGKEALQLLNEMQKGGVKPNEITLINVLNACSHAGLVDEGVYHFNSMCQNFGVTPTLGHYNCMVDLLGRAGLLDEAEDLINKMPFKPDAVIWMTLLGSCRTHGHIDRGKCAALHALQLDPNLAPAYVMLSNIYAATGRWDDAAKIRKLMAERAVKKETGCSWIDVDNNVHEFVVGDTSHPQTEEIYSELERLSQQMREVGYVPDTNLILHDVEEERKEHLLCYHSEKLAVAFGLINTPRGSPLRITKNLRVCVDCHTAAKYISKIVEREIVLRDANRFHHFKDGLCSCGDYW